MMGDLADCLFEIIKEFQRLNQGSLPKKLIIYRDGVSEGQFGRVLEVEYVEIQKVLLQMHCALFVLGASRTILRQLCNLTLRPCETAACPVGASTFVGCVSKTWTW